MKANVGDRLVENVARIEFEQVAGSPQAPPIETGDPWELPVELAISRRGPVLSRAHVVAHVLPHVGPGVQLL